VALDLGPENDPRFRDPFSDSNIEPCYMLHHVLKKKILCIESDITFGMAADQHNSFNVDH
jgi:hypothetical protein